MPNIEIGVDFMVKQNFIYVGIDLHKETHTAVMIDCYNQKLGEITFPNRPADFPKLVTKVKKCNTDAKEVVYGLENAYGYGRPLAVWLIDKGYFVKDVNTAISHRQAKHRGAMYRKSDSDDAEAIALATLNMLDKLPDACPNDAYWSLGQLVHRRDNIMKQRTRSVSLQIDYEEYVKADTANKKRLIIDNILESVKSVSKKEKINYSLFEEDVREFCDNNNIII
ncbi:transposase [Clostridium sp. AM34-9AC]|uniref:IS110 family transposase n=1 Tax=Clostridium sp. AM34-9AC TaxID=2293030 RepID=UPI001FAB2311|nr:transposase [Clostridium sp. AM34-9AC]